VCTQFSSFSIATSPFLFLANLRSFLRSSHWTTNLFILATLPKHIVCLFFMQNLGYVLIRFQSHSTTNIIILTKMSPIHVHFTPAMQKRTSSRNVNLLNAQQLL
jgi:hypothetical protein